MPPRSRRFNAFLLIESLPRRFGFRIISICCTITGAKVRISEWNTKHIWVFPSGSAFERESRGGITGFWSYSGVWYLYALLPVSFAKKLRKSAISASFSFNYAIIQKINCTFAPASSRKVKVHWHRGYIEYTYSILMVQQLKMSDQHYEEPRNVSTPLLGVPLPFISS